MKLQPHYRRTQMRQIAKARRVLQTRHMLRTTRNWWRYVTARTATAQRDNVVYEKSKGKIKNYLHCACCFNVMQIMPILPVQCSELSKMGACGRCHICAIMRDIAATPELRKLAKIYCAGVLVIQHGYSIPDYCKPIFKCLFQNDSYTNPIDMEAIVWKSSAHSLSDASLWRRSNV